MKTFLTDSNGVTVSDFEKLLTGSIFFLASLAVIYKYLTKDFTDYNFVGFTLGIGGLFIGRKIASYLKPERYSQSQQQNINNQTGEIYISQPPNVSEQPFSPIQQNQTNEMPKGY